MLPPFSTIYHGFATAPLPRRALRATACWPRRFSFHIRTSTAEIIRLRHASLLAKTRRAIAPLRFVIRQGGLPPPPRNTADASSAHGTMAAAYTFMAAASILPSLPGAILRYHKPFARPQPLQGALFFFGDNDDTLSAAKCRHYQREIDARRYVAHRAVLVRARRLRAATYSRTSAAPLAGWPSDMRPSFFHARSRTTPIGLSFRAVAVTLPPI